MVQARTAYSFIHSSSAVTNTYTILVVQPVQIVKKKNLAIEKLEYLLKAAARQNSTRISRHSMLV